MKNTAARWFEGREETPCAPAGVSNPDTARSVYLQSLASSRIEDRVSAWLPIDSNIFSFKTVDLLSLCDPITVSLLPGSRDPLPPGGIRDLIEPHYQTDDKAGSSLTKCGFHPVEGPAGEEASPLSGDILSQMRPARGLEPRAGRDERCVPCERRKLRPLPCPIPRYASGPRGNGGIRGRWMKTHPCDPRRLRGGAHRFQKGFTVFPAIQ